MSGISKGSRKTPSVFTVGETYAGVKVLEVTVEGRRTLDRRYLGEFLCCGAVWEINHTTLRQRVLNKRKMCQSCAKTANAKKMTELRNNPAPKPAGPAGVTDRNGHFWPLLTPRSSS